MSSYKTCDCFHVDINCCRIASFLPSASFLALWSSARLRLSRSPRLLVRVSSDATPAMTVSPPDSCRSFFYYVYAAGTRHPRTRATRGALNTPRGHVVTSRDCALTTWKPIQEELRGNDRATTNASMVVNGANNFI